MTTAAIIWFCIVFAAVMLWLIVNTLPVQGWLLKGLVPSSSGDKQSPPSPPDIPLIRTAVHESGHVVAAWACTAVKEVKSAQIDLSGGFAKYVISGDEKWCELVISLSGAAAEAMVFGSWKSMPARKDLKAALACARRIASTGDKAPWPTDKDPTTLPLGRAFDGGLTSQELAIMHQGYAEARRVIRAHGAAYYRLVGLLLQRSTLTQSDLAMILPARSAFCSFGVGKQRFAI